MRVVSLLPSATEALAAVGASELLVGRSHECDYPAAITDRPVLTAPRVHAASPADIDRQVSACLADGQSLYLLDEPLLQALKPELILTQDLCRVCSIDRRTVERAAAGLSNLPRVISFNPTTLEAVLDDLLTLGETVGRPTPARDAVAMLREELFRLSDYTTPFVEGPTVVVLEWCDPLYVAGHWTPQLVERAGARHPLNATSPKPRTGAAEGPVGATQRAAGPSVRLPHEVLLALDPEAIVIAPCGLNLAEAHRQARALAGQPWWSGLRAIRRGGSPGVAVVDGNRSFNRPGPRLVDAFAFLVGWLNRRPELIPPGFAWKPLD